MDENDRDVSVPNAAVFSSTAKELILEINELTSDDERKLFSNITKSRIFRSGFNNSPIPCSIIKNYDECFDIEIRIKNVHYPFRVYHDKLLNMYIGIQYFNNFSNKDGFLKKAWLPISLKIFKRTLKSTICSECNITHSTINSFSLTVPNLKFIDVKKKPQVQIIPPTPDDDFLDTLVDCLICFKENVENVLLDPCKHKIMCKDCVEKLQTWVCPICRCPILNIIIHSITN